MEKSKFDKVYDLIKEGKVSYEQLCLAYGMYKKSLSLTQEQKEYVKSIHDGILSGEITKEDAETRWMNKI